MKYRELISEMTLEEKASLMSGANFWNTKSVDRLGVPSVMLTDGPHGLRKQAGNADHLGINKSVPATCYPTAAGLANTWDEALIEQMGATFRSVSQTITITVENGEITLIESEVKANGAVTQGNSTFQLTFTVISNVKFDK